MELTFGVRTSSWSRRAPRPASGTSPHPVPDIGAADSPGSVRPWRLAGSACWPAGWPTRSRSPRRPTRRARRRLDRRVQRPLGDRRARGDGAQHEPCRIGSAIAYAVGRSPLILANDARGIDELSGGRLVLGLGTGTKGMQIGWHGVKDPESPALRLEELVPLLRRIWRLHEGPVKHEGRFYSMNLTATAEVLPPLREQIPIFTAGVNRRMIETAGRVSDGLVCHPTFSSRYVHEVVRPAIAAGAERTGRDPAAVEIVGMLLCSVHDDEEVARRELAAQLAFYAAPRAYAPMLEASGFAAEARADPQGVRRRRPRGDDRRGQRRDARRDRRRRHARSGARRHRPPRGGLRPPRRCTRRASR